MALPRFLPLIAVAAGGVLALKAITSLEVMPDVFHAASAFAADGKKAEKPAARTVAPKASGKGEVDRADDPTQSYGVDPALMAADAASQGKDAAATAPMTPICATSVNDLAKQAGISPNELNILQSLGQRRAQLDQREQQLNSRAQLIEAADSKRWALRAATEEGMLVGISSGATLAAIEQKLAELPPGTRILGFNYDTGERYLSVPDFLPEISPLEWA